MHFIDPKPHPLIEFISKMYDLAAEVIKYDHEVVGSLKPSLSLIYSILQKQVSNQKKPLIKSCCIYMYTLNIVKCICFRLKISFYIVHVFVKNCYPHVQ